MATATKNARTLVASASLAVGNTAGGTLSLTTALGATLTLRITNGGTGPTVGCRARVRVSKDGSDWYDYEVFRAGVVAGALYEWTVDLPASVMHAQAVFDEHTGQAVTVQADGQELTSVG